MFLLLCFAAILRVKGQHDFDPFGGGGYGGTYQPNGNFGDGYSSAYGNWGRGSWGNPLSNVPRCRNGGAQIGNCRMEDDAICTALGGTCVQSACCTIPFFSLSSTTTATITTRSAPPEVEGVASRKMSKYTTSAPAIDAAQEKKICVSGLSSVGECATDDNCPALHRCEDKKCCYNT